MAIAVDGYSNPANLQPISHLPMLGHEDGVVSFWQKYAGGALEL